MNITNNKKITGTKKQAQATVIAERGDKVKAIKLGIDVHLGRYVVVRIVEGGTPQPPQRVGP